MLQKNVSKVSKKNQLLQVGKQQDCFCTKSQLGNELSWQKTLEDTGARLETLPTKSMKQVQEIGASRTSGQRATKPLKLWPCKKIVHALKEHDLTARINLRNCFLGLYMIEKLIYNQFLSDVA